MSYITQKVRCEPFFWHIFPKFKRLKIKLGGFGNIKHYVESSRGKSAFFG
jgi:hypothetical protein